MTRPKTRRYICQCGLVQEIEIPRPPMHRHQAANGAETWHQMTEQPDTPEENPS